MADCCGGHDTLGARAACPHCARAGRVVSMDMVRTLVEVPRSWRQGVASVWVCEGHDCPVLYFDVKGVRVAVTALAGRPAFKGGGDDALLCYCFGVTWGAATRGAWVFVVEKTRSGKCRCASCHPAGRCCLKDWPKQE